MTRGCSTGAFYVGAVHRTKQQSTLPIKASEEESPRVSFHPRVPGSSSANGDLSVYLQRELCVSPRATGPSARRASADRNQRMTTAHTTADRREGGKRQRRNERAYVRQVRGAESAGCSGASHGRSEPREAENRMTEARLPGLPGLPGVFDTPSLKLRGGEGGRARVGVSHPGKAGIIRGCQQ